MATVKVLPAFKFTPSANLKPGMFFLRERKGVILLAIVVEFPNRANTVCAVELASLTDRKVVEPQTMPLIHGEFVADVSNNVSIHRDMGSYSKRGEVGSVSFGLPETLLSLKSSLSGFVEEAQVVLETGKILGENEVRSHPWWTPDWSIALEVQGKEPLLMTKASGQGMQKAKVSGA